MTTLHLDVRSGATASALLGAMVEVGASLERVEHAVAALGDGDVRLTVSGGKAGTEVRVRAPQGSPDVDTWRELRPRIALLATDQRIADDAVAVLDRLFAARGAVHGVPAADVDVDPFSGLDDLAGTLALTAALADLAPTQVTASAIGHGTGTLETIEGPVDMPGPVVAELIAGRPTLALPRALQLLDPVGAAFLAALTVHAEESYGDSAATGRGVLHGRGRTANVLVARLLLSAVRVA